MEIECSSGSWPLRLGLTGPVVQHRTLQLRILYRPPASLLLFGRPELPRRDAWWGCGRAGPADLALEPRKSRNLLKKRRDGSRHGQGRGETISGESGTGAGGSGSAVRRSAARREGGCAPGPPPP